MDEKSKYFTFQQEGNSHILSDRMEINWKEVLIFPAPFFFVMMFLTGNWIVATIVTLFVAVLYMLFRFAAWIYYNELKIDTKTGKMTIKKNVSKM